CPQRGLRARLHLGGSFLCLLGTWMVSSRRKEPPPSAHAFNRPRDIALLLDHELVALHNLQTGKSVNYLRSDPPLLWRRCEAVIAVLATVGGIAAFALAGGVAPLGAVVATLIGAPGAVSLRLLRQVLARRAIDRALIEALRQVRQPGLSHPVLRRVK
ncbi:MAG: hypothetical protein ACK5V2_22150, partial [Pseudomonadota bacterium]|nr:hypothetical protein [Rubrivivax sp.]